MDIKRADPYHIPDDQEMAEEAEYGYLMTLADFIEQVKMYYFTDDDGWGDCLDENGDVIFNRMYPSKSLKYIKEGLMKDVTHVRWYNK